MLDKTMIIDEVEVRVHVADRDAGDDCFDVDGARWCVSPGGRFMLTATVPIDGDRFFWTTKWNEDSHWPAFIADDLTVAVRRQLDRLRKKKLAVCDTQEP
jgi:hypothetical protein